MLLRVVGCNRFVLEEPMVTEELRLMGGKEIDELLDSCSLI